MSYSWAFFGDFKIPAARLESLKVAESPWLTTLESIRDDAALSDWIYDGTQFHYRSLFDKSDYQDKREIIDTLLAAVVAHGGEGTGTYIGFDDGGPDDGEIITIERGAVTHAPFSSAKEAAAIRAGRGYQALRARVAEAFEPINRVAAKSRASTKPKAAPRSRAMSRSAGGLVSTLRMSAVAAGAVVSSASTARFAPFLDIRHPDCREACGLFASLFHGSGGDRYTFKMSEHALAPLLELAAHEPAARHALASAAGSLWRGHAYPETRAAIEALLPFESEAPWAQTQFRLPWQDQRPASLTGPRQVALMHLYRAECLLALGESEAGEQAFEQAIERAERAAVPGYMQLSSASQYWGTHADFRLFALVRSAYALRLRLLGQDACLYRKIAKSKQAPKSDPVGLATATRYAESALAVVAARAPEQYAGLTPKPIEGHEFTPSQRAYHWQWRAYLEAALLDEMNGNLDRARHRVGQAKFLAALEDPSHDPVQDHVKTLVECVARRGAVNTPLDAGTVSPSRLARSRAAPTASKPQTPAEKRLAARRQSARNDSGWITTELYGMVTGGKHQQARPRAAGGRRRRRSDRSRPRRLDEPGGDLHPHQRHED